MGGRTEFFDGLIAGVIGCRLTEMLSLEKQECLLDIQVTKRSLKVINGLSLEKTWVRANTFRCYKLSVPQLAHDGLIKQTVAHLVPL